MPLERARVAQGKIVESWNAWGMLGLLQIGVVPATDAAKKMGTVGVVTARTARDQGLILRGAEGGNHGG
jgi:hypothetical protein